MKKTAIVTIDYQMDYFRGGRFPLWMAHSALRRGLSVLAAARDQGIPVIHVRHESPDPSSSFLTAGTAGTELHPELRIPADGSEPIVRKGKPDSFLGTDLEARLRAMGIETVVWMGMISWMCVDTTVRAAAAKGFSNILVEDACASGWLKHGGLPVFPWTSHRAFMAALGARHSRTMRAREAVLLIGGA